VRVIAGSAKGHTLAAPRGGATRPATDRIRETLFALLEPILGMRVCSISSRERAHSHRGALARAAHATFVERSADALKTLRKNIRATGFDAQAEVIGANVLGFLEQRAAGPYDVVFCDPPSLTLRSSRRPWPIRVSRRARSGRKPRRAVHKKHQPRVPEGARVQRVRTSVRKASCSYGTMAAAEEGDLGHPVPRGRLDRSL